MNQKTEGNNMNKQEAVIFDIDGTVANIDHRLHLIEKSADRPVVSWDNFFAEMHLDGLYDYAKDIVDICRMRQYAILFVTGRGEEYREKTEKWLFENLRLYPMQYTMFMRPTGDHMQDDHMKEGILNREILPHYNIRFVLEDRMRVVQMYRKNGLRVLHVEDGLY
jgi:acid phosphatase class B